MFFLRVYNVLEYIASSKDLRTCSVKVCCRCAVANEGEKEIENKNKGAALASTPVAIRRHYTMVYRKRYEINLYSKPAASLSCQRHANPSRGKTGENRSPKRRRCGI